MGSFEPARSVGAAPTPATPNDTSAQAAAAAASFAHLLRKLDYLNEADLAQVRLAYRFADQAHLGQLRHSGEPYITHPIAVAALCAEWKLDAQALMAALLHDAMEDCGISKADLVERFGAPVAELVDGLTKLEKLQFISREENQAESFRKMLLAMARDVRVILIKLADRSHNMRTLGASPRSKWRRIATETLDVYAPIAHRLGLNRTYRELQEKAFEHLMPWRYQVLARAVARARGRRRDLIEHVQSDVQAAFAHLGLDCEIAGREKTLYSIYRKMDDKNLSFAQVSDIYGLRLILTHTLDCYTGLGVLHQLYKPVPGRFKDHIAIAKVNGYQSLHTTVVGPAGINIEFQLRTPEMHRIAETGVAAHWLYKQNGSAGPEPSAPPSKWLQSLLDIQSETRDATEFWDHVKVDLVPDAVYVFTPKSQILSVPRGATVLDFAYAIHSNVGDHAVAASINGHEVALRTEVHSGDVIEVRTDPQSHPHPGWLGFVRTARARSKIRHHLKTLAQHEAQALGEKLLTQALRAEGLDLAPDQAPDGVWDKLLRFSGLRNRTDLYAELGLGRRIASVVAKKMATLLIDQGVRPDALLLSRERLMHSVGEDVQNHLALDGSEGTTVRYATCCHPIPGDALLGYLGRGEGLSVHRSNCNVAKRQWQRDPDCFIRVEWSDEPTRAFDAAIRVTVQNGRGVLAKVASALATAEADITHIDMADEAVQGALDLHFVIAVRDVTQLELALRQLRHTACVRHAERTGADPAAA